MSKLKLKYNEPNLTEMLNDPEAYADVLYPMLMSLYIDEHGYTLSVYLCTDYGENPYIKIIRNGREKDYHSEEGKSFAQLYNEALAEYGINL